MPTGIYDRTKSKPNAGLFKKGQHPSCATEFKKGVHYNAETEFKLGIGYTGVRTFYDRDSWRERQSLSHKGQHSSPETEFKKGEHRSPDTEYKELVPGGVSTDDMKIRNSPEYRNWRSSVYKRDKYTCQRCGSKGRLHAHHIKLFSTNPESRFDIDNGITYCIPCHRFIHARIEILNSLEHEYQDDRRKLLLLRLETLETYNTPYLISTRGTFQSYSINKDTLRILPRKKSKKAILKEVQLSLFKGGDA